MRKSFLFAFYLTLLISPNVLSAKPKLSTNKTAQRRTETRTFNIMSIEGIRAKVRVLPDYERHNLNIIHLKDTIKISDFWGVPPEMIYVSKQFFKINYEVRGGSNLGLRNSLLICVSNNKLYEALHILSYAEWDSQDLTKKYQVKFALFSRGKNHALTASVSDVCISSINPQKNYYYTSSSQLQFDKEMKVFYNIKKDVSDTFKINNRNQVSNRKVEGNFPEILLGDNKYILIEGQWFEFNNNELTKL